MKLFLIVLLSAGLAIPSHFFVRGLRSTRPAHGQDSALDSEREALRAELARLQVGSLELRRLANESADEPENRAEPELVP